MDRHGSPHGKSPAHPRNYLYAKPLTAPSDRAARARAYLRRYATTATLPTTAGNVAGFPFSSLSRPLAGRSDTGLDARRAVAVPRRTGGTGYLPRRNRVPPKKEPGTSQEGTLPRRNRVPPKKEPGTSQEGTGCLPRRNGYPPKKEPGTSQEGTGCLPRRNRVPPKKEPGATPYRIRLTGARQPTALASSHRAGSNANVPLSLSVTCDLQECLETRRGVGTELRALEEQETHSCVTQRSRSTWRY